MELLFWVRAMSLKSGGGRFWPILGNPPNGKIWFDPIIPRYSYQHIPIFVFQFLIKHHINLSFLVLGIKQNVYIPLYEKSWRRKEPLSRIKHINITIILESRKQQKRIKMISRRKRFFYYLFIFGGKDAMQLNLPKPVYYSLSILSEHKTLF